jgi:hypothetical protein
MSSFSCPHQVNELCQKVKGAYCRPGMRGCVLCGKVEFHHGGIPDPVWPPGADPRLRSADGAAPNGRGPTT